MEDTYSFDLQVSKNKNKYCNNIVTFYKEDDGLWCYKEHNGTQCNGGYWNGYNTLKAAIIAYSNEQISKQAEQKQEYDYSEVNAEKSYYKMSKHFGDITINCHQVVSMF
mgnify:FL=1|jgi:hypothetical protein